MARFNHSDRKTLANLVRDVVIMDLDDAQCHMYIKERFSGRDISESELLRIKRAVRSDANVNYWLTNHVKIGFLIEHKNLIDEIKLLKKIAWEQLNKELNKPVGTPEEGQSKADFQDPRYLNALNIRIDHLNKRVAELNLASPVVAQMKAFIDIAMKKGQAPSMPLLTTEIQKVLNTMYSIEEPTTPKDRLKIDLNQKAEMEILDGDAFVQGDTTNTNNASDASNNDDNSTTEPEADTEEAKDASNNASYANNASDDANDASDAALVDEKATEDAAPGTETDNKEESQN